MCSGFSGIMPSIYGDQFSTEVVHFTFVPLVSISCCCCCGCGVFIVLLSVCFLSLVVSICCCVMFWVVLFVVLLLPSMYGGDQASTEVHFSFAPLVPLVVGICCCCCCCCGMFPVVLLMVLVLVFFS